MTKTITLCYLIALSFSPALAHANETSFSPQAAFITSDIDRSGAIDLKEFADHVEKAEGKNSDQAAQGFTSLDKNHDDRLTLGEMQYHSQAMATPVR